ncbi:hypothetical protein VTN77DRAFT_631 [Rasamsonia byssochlamydoides]|uniref:uncharacterized protein n=1 Tax=Rasamsonia byssochlamydoides TaxID=89139 RepID=UPI0037430CD4
MAWIRMNNSIVTLQTPLSIKNQQKKTMISRFESFGRTGRDKLAYRLTNMRKVYNSQNELRFGLAVKGRRNGQQIMTKMKSLTLSLDYGLHRRLSFDMEMEHSFFPSGYVVSWPGVFFFLVTTCEPPHAIVWNSSLESERIAWRLPPPLKLQSVG